MLELRDQYYNMREKIEPLMHIIDTAFAAMEAVGVKPNVNLSVVVRMAHNFLSKVYLAPISLQVAWISMDDMNSLLSEYGESDECYREDCRTCCKKII